MHLLLTPYDPQSALHSKYGLFDTPLSLQKNISSKREKGSNRWPSYRIQLLHYLGCHKHCISPTECSGLMYIYFERLVKYCTVQTRTGQTEFTASAEPAHFKRMPLLFVLLPDSQNELRHSRPRSSDIHTFPLKLHSDTHSGIATMIQVPLLTSVAFSLLLGNICPASREDLLHLR